MEFENIHLVAGLGFALALVFGAVANKTHFCAMGAVSDWINIGLRGRMGAWVLAMGIAVAGTQGLELSGLIDLSDSVYRPSAFGLGGYVVGGVLFGIGMTLAGGCGQRNLVRLGSGNLKALVVVLVLAVTAYATLRGILGAVRLSVFDPLTVDLADFGIADQGLAFLFGGAGVLRWCLALVISALFIGWAFRQSALRESRDNILGGITVGVVIVLGWAITGIAGVDDFDPLPLESVSFIAPTGNSLMYLMTYTGATISFGVAIVAGVIAGSFFYAVATRSFVIETFAHRGDMINHLVGAALMGFGGVLSLGCTIGQGVSGISTLALGSFVAVSAIIFGSAVTLRAQYHRMDDLSLFHASIKGIADILLPWNQR